MKAQDLSLIPKPAWWKERSNFPKFPLDIHIGSTHNKQVNLMCNKKMVHPIGSSRVLGDFFLA